MNNLKQPDYQEGFHRTVELNGVRIAYHDKCKFEVQLGRYKGKYKTVFTSLGNFHQAFKMYMGYNVGNGYKKRLICNDFNRRLILRQFGF